MIEQARRRHPDLRFQVAELSRLPFPDKHFGAVLLWYSIIHSAPADLSVLIAEVARVLAPGGVLLTGFQTRDGVRDLGPVYARFGHQVELVRYGHEVEAVASALAASGLTETVRLVRRPRDAHEVAEQAFLLAVRA